MRVSVTRRWDFPNRSQMASLGIVFVWLTYFFQVFGHSQACMITHGNSSAGNFPYTQPYQPDRKFPKIFSDQCPVGLRRWRNVDTGPYGVHTSHADLDWDSEKERLEKEKMKPRTKAEDEAQMRHAERQLTRPQRRRPDSVGSKRRPNSVGRKRRRFLEFLPKVLMLGSFIICAWASVVINTHSEPSSSSGDGFLCRFCVYVDSTAHAILVCASFPLHCVDGAPSVSNAGYL